MPTRLQLLGGIALIALTACSPTEPFEPEWPELPAGAVAVPYNVLPEVHTTAISGIMDRRRLVIRTQQDWESFWAEFAANASPLPPAPAIDFDQQMVIAATMGRRNTGGFTISIEGIFEDGDRLITRVLETAPGPGCLTIQVITAPATAVVLDATDATVEFVEGNAATRC